MKVNGSQLGELNFIVPISNGVLRPPHTRQIGAAIYLFALLEDRVTSGEREDGIVLRGKPIPDNEWADILGFNRKTVAKQRRRLEKYGYIKTTRAGSGFIYRVAKSKKWLWLRLSQHGKFRSQDDQDRSQDDRIRNPAAPKGANQIRQSNDNLGQSSDYKELTAWWNVNCEPLPKIRAFTDERKSKLRTRQKNNPQFIEDLKEAVGRLKLSDFATQQWKPGIDWLLENDTNVHKVLEGKYDNRGGQRGKTGSAGNNGRAGHRAGPFIPSALQKSIPAPPNALTRPRER